MLRRKFLVGGILAVGGTASGISLYRSTTLTPAQEVLSEIVSNLAKVPGAIRLGEIFRNEVQANKQPITSLRSISTRLEGSHGEFSVDNVGIMLDRQIQTDLRTNQIHVIDGWYFTRTELDLCALAAASRLT